MTEQVFLTFWRHLAQPTHSYMPDSRALSVLGARRLFQIELARAGRLNVSLDSKSSPKRGRSASPGIDFAGFCDLLVVIALQWFSTLTANGGLFGASFRRDDALAVWLTRCGLAAAESGNRERIEQVTSPTQSRPAL